MRLHPKALIAGILVGVVVVGGALALAVEIPTAPQSPISRVQAQAEPVEDAGIPDWAPPGTVPGREVMQAASLDNDPAAETDFTTDGIPGVAIVDQCRGPNPPTTSLHCRAIIAIAEGRLAPGAYSDEELRDRMDE